MGGIPAHSFIITDLYGREVWDSRKTQIILLPSAHPRLAPGEAIDLETVIRYENWNPRTDPYFYEPLPSRPGYYFIYAIVDRGQKELDLRSSRQLIKIVK